MWLKKILQTLLFMVYGILASPEPDPKNLHQIQPNAVANIPQNLESVIASIDDRLRALDNVYTMRFTAPRWEISIEAINRKLESLESKLARIETVMELRVDKLTESLNSRSIKDELSKEQLGRKIDVIYERLNHRMSFMESRIENNIAKFQSSLDSTLTRANTQLEHLEKSGNDVENDIIELGTAAEESKTMLQVINTTLNKSVNETTYFFNEYSQLNNITHKVLTTCEGSTVKILGIEEMQRKALDLVTVIRRELVEGVKAVKATANRRITCPSVSEGAIDYLIEKVETMSRKNEDNYLKLDTTIERLHMKQERYQESCHRLQHEEPQIENRIVEILEKIIDLLDNRTYTTDKNYQNLLELLKSHHSYVAKTVGHTSDTVQRLGNQMTSDVKSIFANNPATEKIDSIIASLQELQDEFQELNATITSSHQLTPLQSQSLLNNTATILKTIQHLNENMSTIIDKLSDYYRNFADTYETETDISSKILNIFNMTEADLAKVTNGGSLIPTNTTFNRSNVKLNMSDTHVAINNDSQFNDNRTLNNEGESTLHLTSINSTEIEESDE